MKKIDNDITKEAIKIVNDERNKWSDAVAFVTDRVAFQMRNLIRTCRKNYWGVFDSEIDPITNRKKTFVPLTRVLVEGATKSNDLDTKDINARAKNEKGYEIVKIVRSIIRNALNKIFFGEILDENTRALAIDGTIVWKTFESDGKPIRKSVDLLNAYIDPTEDNIQSAFRFTERSIMLPEEIESMTGWINTNDLVGSNIVSRIDGNYNQITTGSTAKYRDVWEMWGKIPKWLITGKKKEDKELIDGHLVVSGLETSNPICHLVEENTKKDDDGNVIKPYEECRYSKVSNRWYGVGIAEKVMMMQIWLNTIVNIRINRSYISQLGLFKIKKGSGITPQMLSRLGSNGAIVVNNIDDIEQFVMNEASQASYQDEERVLDWAQRDTNIYDQSIGEATPASKPATTSVIENNSQKSGSKLVKDAIGSFLERWIDRHYLPILAKNLKIDELVEIAGNTKEIESIIDSIVAIEADKELEKLYSMGVVPPVEVMQMVINKEKAKMMKKENFFIKLVKKLITSDVYTKVYVTNEELDPAVTVQNIMSMLKFLPPEAQIALTKEAMDLMGLDVELPKIQPPQQPIAPQPQGIIPSMMNANNPQPQQTQANAI